MANALGIRENMEVVGADDEHVGIVDGFEGKDQIKLSRFDTGSGGQHHWVGYAEIGWVDDKVHLLLPASDMKFKFASSAEA